MRNEANVSAAVDFVGSWDVPNSNPLKPPPIHSGRRSLRCPQGNTKGTKLISKDNYLN
jgi:hypothetical protein